MTRYERTELAKALLEAAGDIYLVIQRGEPTIEHIHQLLKNRIPRCFTADPEWRDDQNAWYEAKERWLATGEYSNTGKNCNIFYDGWNAARDHYQGYKPRNPGDGQP